MKVHHLNCATMCPFPGRLVSFRGSFFGSGRFVAHCLLAESRDGLVLVDTGIGLDDVATPRRRLGLGMVAFARPRLDEQETALRQVERLGFKREDVRHVAPTHLDPDHAGGLADFPAAQVHVREPEHAAATAKLGFHDRARYRQVHWAHGPSWRLYPARGGERWFGFEGVQPLAGVPDVLLVPLDGHTRGHSGIAVRDEQGWVLHAGDAYFSRSEIDAERPRCPAGLGVFQWWLEVDRAARLANQARLRELARDHSGEVRVFCAHDPDELARF